MKRPSPSMSVALLALFVALCGTATAARSLITGHQIKDGSIGRVDIATSAVDSSRIANGSVRSGDLDAATQASLAQAGTQALEAFRKLGPGSVPAEEERTVATLSDIPPGAYAIFAKAVLSGAANNGLLGQGESVSGRCHLDAGGDSDNSLALLGTPGAAAPNGINTQLTHTFDAPGKATLTCRVGKATWSASDASIIALRVAPPSRQQVEGR
jgi:hypothetical protein